MFVFTRACSEQNQDIIKSVTLPPKQPPAPRCWPRPCGHYSTSLPCCSAHHPVCQSVKLRICRWIGGGFLVVLSGSFSFFFKIYFYFCVLFLFLCICMQRVCRCLLRPGEGVRSLGAGITSSCELPYVSAQNWSQALLWKSSMCS